MGNCKFEYTADDSSTTFNYTFEQNPELPFNIYTKKLGEKKYRLNNQSLKIYKGVEKYFIDLNFLHLTADQKNNMVGYNDKIFNFYVDSDLADFVSTTTLNQASQYIATDKKILKLDGNDNFVEGDVIRLSTTAEYFIVKLVKNDATEQIITVDRDITTVYPIGTTIYKKNYFEVAFANEPKFALDENNVTYTGQINLQEV